MNKKLDPSEQSLHEGATCLYEHFLELVKREKPEQLLERFRLLFVESTGYPDRDVAEVFDQLLLNKKIDPEFRFILNRCCHIFMNHWYPYPDQRSTIIDLISLLENAPRNQRSVSMRSRSGRKLFDLMEQFMHTEQFVTLKRLSQVIQPPLSVSSSEGSVHKPLGNFLSRYPYLYQHCLITDGCDPEYQKMIKKLQSQRQKQYEIDLSQYVAHQVRKAEVARKGTSLSFGRTEATTIKNPTLLSDRELFSALRHFTGKNEEGATYRSLAQRFLNDLPTTVNYRRFKDNLYDYLTEPIMETSYGRRLFSDKLHKQLENTFVQSDSQKYTDFLMIRTCSQLLNFLIVESPQRPEHFIFIDLIANLGPTLTTGLLLKIVLICHQVRPYLEKRLAILFTHYESTEREKVTWLVKSLENLNLALSTHFGTVDVSFVTKIG